MKILIFINFVPYLKCSTNEFRMFHIIKKLQEKATVKVLVVKPDYVEEFKEKYNVDVEVIPGKEDKRKRQVDLLFFHKRTFYNTFFRINPKDFEAKFNSFQPDVILVNSLGFFDYVKKYNVPVIVNSSDVKYMEFSRQSANWPKFLRNWFVYKTRKIRRWERREFETCDMILFGSMKDMANVNSQMQLITSSRYLPVFCEKFEKNDLPNTHSITFVTGTCTGAEQKKLKEYINKIHPKLMAKYSDFHANIIIDKEMDNIPGITFSRELSDEILRNTKIFVLNNKYRNNYSYFIVKAAAYGVPILGFEKSTDVFSVRDNSKYMIIASKNISMTKSLVNVFDDNRALEKVRSNAFDYVREHYDENNFDKIIDSLIEKFSK